MCVWRAAACKQLVFNTGVYKRLQFPQNSISGNLSLCELFAFQGFSYENISFFPTRDTRTVRVRPSGQWKQIFNFIYFYSCWPQPSDSP